MEKAEDSKSVSNPPTDPIDVLREHVLGAQHFGFTYMLIPHVLEAIDRAKSGQLGPFRPGL